MYASAKLLEKRLGEPIEFRGDFENQFRISHFTVRWWVAPRFFAFYYSTDKVSYMEGVGWSPLAGRSTFEFDEPLWINRFKMLMKTPSRGDRLGFYSIAMYVKVMTVMLVNKGDSKKCFA
jgi:hypothetical protein